MATPKKTTPKATTSTPKKPAARKPATKGNGADKSPSVVMTLSHDQIAKKAYEIWLAKGCPQGQDAANWKEAVAALSGAST